MSADEKSCNPGFDGREQPGVDPQAGRASGQAGAEEMPERPRMVDVRLPGKGNLNCHGARPVHQITPMIKWIRTRR